MHFIQPIDRASPVAIPEQIAQQVRRAVERGWLSPGDRLPPQLALSIEYGVTLQTVRRASRILTDEGWIITLPSGSYVADAGEADDPDLAAPAAVARLAAKMRQMQRRLLALELQVYGNSQKKEPQ